MAKTKSVAASKQKPKRPPIPATVQLKLWVAAAGRCEFLNCNKSVWRDGLTLQEDNYAHIAHIISWTPNGPRGDAELSPKLAKDFSNLMLVCLEHSKLIDGKHKDQYPVDTLRAFKQEHERRIQLQTSLTDNLKTTVVRFMANIGQRKMHLPVTQVQQGVLSLPRYPEEHEILMDFTDFPGQGTKSYWNNFAKDVSRRFKDKFSKSFDRQLPNHLSIFALGPIPLLVHLGNVIGNITPSDVFQKHRDTDNWIWKPAAATYEVVYKVSQPNKLRKAKEVALLVSISGKVQRDAVAKMIPDHVPIYEISVENPGPGKLNTLANLTDFRRTYRSVVDKIRDTHGHDVIIHFFPAVPAPVAVVCGQGLLPKVDPHLVVYDYNHENGGYIKTLKIN